MFASLSLLPPGLDVFQEVSLKLLYKNQFLPVLKVLIQQAKTKIYVVQYEFFYEKGKSKHPVNSILYDLQAATFRGVEVKILLNSAFHNIRMKNKQLWTFEYLKSAGILVKLYSSSNCCHPKVIIIDDDILVIGSHNFTVTALTKNIEVSVAIKDKNLNKEMTSIFSKLWE